MLPPDPIRLQTGLDCELWLVELQVQPDNKMQAWLSESEHRKAARFVFERDRRRYVVAPAEIELRCCGYIFRVIRRNVIVFPCFIELCDSVT